MSDLIGVIRDTLVRRWKIMAAVTAAILVVGVALIMMMTPTYVAVSRVQIDPSRNPLAKSEANKDDALSPEALETQVSVIYSLDVATKVVDKLKLINDPEFAGKINSEDFSRMSQQDRKTAVANQLLKSVSVEREKLTYIIAIAAASVDAQKAARIANAFADQYLDTKVNTMTGAARNQVQWFQDRLSKLQAEVREADAKVAQYRAAAGIVGSSSGPNGGGGTIADQRVAPLSSSIASAESEAAAAQSQLSAAEQQAARGGLDSVTAVRSSPVVAELRRQRAELLRSIGEIQARYGDKHPESLRVRGQLETVDKQINEEGERVLGSLRANAAAAQAQAGSLRRSMSTLEGERARDMNAAVQADSLERESTAKRTEYDRLSQMLLESTQAAQNSIAQAEIVGRAEAPMHPSRPNKPLLIALTLLVGLAAGAGTIAVQEMMVSGLRSSDDAEQLGLPLLAAIPLVEKKLSAKPADLLIEKPTSIYSEAFRIARASILGVKSDKPASIIAFTSALPNEGKTTTALSFARALAIGESKTLLLDCDVRRAALRSVVEQPDRQYPGIVEILHGEATLEDAIRPSSVENLDLLVVKEPYFSAEDLFGGDRMKALLAKLSEHYERIVLDLPPLVGLADGRFLSVLADATVLAVRWDETPTKAVGSAIDWLRADGANPIGIVFTMVDVRAPAMGSLYYSKQYSSYYQNN